VLLVDHDVLLRLSLADVLRERGFNVIEAVNADEAMTILNTPTSIHVVITDVRMPGTIDGIGLVRFIAANRPDLRVIVMSGDVVSGNLPSPPTAVRLTDFSPNRSPIPRLRASSARSCRIPAVPTTPEGMSCCVAPTARSRCAVGGTVLSPSGCCFHERRARSDEAYGDGSRRRERDPHPPRHCRLPALVRVSRHRGSRRQRGCGGPLAARACGGRRPRQCADAWIDGWFCAAAWVRAQRPEVGVILVGTVARAADAAAELCEQGPMLSKPYEPQAVGEWIKRLLAERDRTLGMWQKPSAAIQGLAPDC